MGRPKKPNQKHTQPNQQHGNHNRQVILSQLVTIGQLLKNYRKLLRETDQNFAYLLSTRWLGNWKSYTGYESFLQDDDPEQAKNFGKKKPSLKINDDLLAKHNAKFVSLPEAMVEYSYLNQPVDEDYQDEKEFIVVDQKLWMALSEQYPDAIEIKRPLRKRQSGQPYVDVALHHFNFVVVGPQLVEKFKNITSEDYEKMTKGKKKEEALEKLLPSKRVRVPKIWSLEALGQFFKKFVPAYTQTNSEKLRMWRMQNYLSFFELRDNIISYFRGENEGILGNQLNNTERDVDDFIKTSSVILVLCGDFQIVRQPPPKTPVGYCEECIEDKKLTVTCLCEEVFYCSLKCRCDDTIYHHLTCEQAYDSDDDEQYQKKAVYVETKEVRCGLNNLGNTCFMNSSLQCLINIEWLREYFSSNKYSKLIPEKQIEQNKGMFAHKFSKFVKKMIESETYSPYSLKTQINQFIFPFRGYNQHDANDFITYFINTLNDFSQKHGEQAFADFILNNLTGKFKSKVTCPSCKGVSVTDDVFLQIPLPIKPKVAEKQIQYTVIKGWNQYIKGSALVTDWQGISAEVGQSTTCRKFVGNEGGDLRQITDQSLEEVYKKHRKQTLVFYPNLHPYIDGLQVKFNMTFSKMIANNEMKTAYGYPIIFQTGSQTKLWELYLYVASMVGAEKQGLDAIQQLKSKIQGEISELKQKYEQQKSTEQSKEEELSQEQKLQQQEKLAQLQLNTKKIEQKYSAQLGNLRTKLGFRLVVVSKRKNKKPCNYCNKKCSLCLLPFSLITTVEQFQNLGESAELEIDIYFDQKRQIVEKYLKSTTRNQFTTLEECLTEFEKPEKLDEYNAWYCHPCDNMVLAEKELKICGYPNTLIIQLKRFKEQNGKKVKNNETVWYPERLEIKEKGVEYQLTGILVHEGSLDAGHYWAVCRKGEEYYVFNDSEVKKVTDYFQKGAYILVYEKV